MADQAPTASPLFSALAAKYGIGTALQILSLLNPQGSTLSKGLGATQAAGGLASGAGSLTGNAGLQGLGKGLGGAAALGGLGYEISQIAGNQNLSDKQKAGASGGVAADALVSYLVPYGWLYAPTKAIGGAMEKSGSPQIRTGGAQILSPLRPIMGLGDVLSGRSSPRAAATNMWESWMRPLGLGHKPTTGTMFRGELGRVLPQVGIKGADLNRYNIDPAAYNALSPAAREAGMKLGTLLSGYTGDAKKNPNAYSIQASNILLNKYGNDLPTILNQVLPMLQPQKKAA